MPNSFDFSSLFEEWEQLREQLAPLFKVKDETRKKYMEQGIQLLTVITEKAEGTIPINFSERFDFVKLNSTNYSAFRQLDELFKETKKKIAVKRLRLNKK